MSYGRILERIKPEVEKPTGRTTVWRPILLVVLLVIIAIVSVTLAALWLLNTSRIIDPAFVGPVIVLAVLAIAADSIKPRPLTIKWKEGTNERQAFSVLLVGVLATLLYLTNNWPMPNYEYHKAFVLDVVTRAW